MVQTETLTVLSRRDPHETSVLGGSRPFREWELRSPQSCSWQSQNLLMTRRAVVWPAVLVYQSKYCGPSFQWATRKCSTSVVSMLTVTIPCTLLVHYCVHIHGVGVARQWLRFNFKKYIFMSIVTWAFSALNTTLCSQNQHIKITIISHWRCIKIHLQWSEILKISHGGESDPAWKRKALCGRRRSCFDAENGREEAGTRKY